MILDHLSHQTRDTAADAGDHMHNALALGLVAQSAFDGFDLTANTTNASKQFLLLSDGVTHATI
ncbi:hypothetical protein GCM10022626_10670 [[Pseudomonas] carboxydohydrogena]